MWAGKGVRLWRGGQVDISAHVGLEGCPRDGQEDISALVGLEGCPSLGKWTGSGLEGCPSLGKWTGRYFCPCWLGRVSLSGEVGWLIFMPMLAGKGILLWGGEQVDISTHIGWEGCLSLGR
jgi:hypothetical protein